MAINFSAVTTALQNSSGNNIPHIVQYKETVTNDWISKTNGQQITEFNCNITPSNSTSHILLISFVMVGADTNADLALVFTKGGTNMSDSQGTSGTVNASCVTGMNVTSTQAAHYTAFHVDHPNTTSQVTYGLKAYPNGSRTMYINRRGADTSYSGRTRLICMEIGDI